MASCKTLLCLIASFAILNTAISQEPPVSVGSEGSGSGPPSSSSSLSSSSTEESSESSVDTNESGDGPQNRFFFPKVTRTTCNYTTEPGLSCASCNQVLLCNRNNVGILKTCHFLKRFCNNGRCSFFPGPACNPTTTEATATEITTTEGSTATDGTATDGTTTTGG